MTQLLHPVEPFGEVNVHHQPGGSIQVVATILMEPDVEGARCGLALDGSASMKKMYGANLPLSPLFARPAAQDNVVEPVARAVAAYLAQFSSTGKANLCYWSCSPDGSGIEEIGEVGQAEAATLSVPGPRKLPWGRKTMLLPPVRYFVDQVLSSAPWAICVFVTDGIIEDLVEVKVYCMDLARRMAIGKRSFIKLVLIGLGEDVDERQMEELDEMFDGSELRDMQGHAIALWGHKLARQMHHLEEIFAGVASEDVIVAHHGRVLDDAGRVVRDYSDGVPARLRFMLPVRSTSFTLVLPGGRVQQALGEAVRA